MLGIDGGGLWVDLRLDDDGLAIDQFLLVIDESHEGDRERAGLSGNYSANRTPPIMKKALPPDKHAELAQAKTSISGHLRN
jgi:hypothetical protein